MWSATNGGGDVIERPSRGGGYRPPGFGRYWNIHPSARRKGRFIKSLLPRWPRIPEEELHASSVEHPADPSWRWVLHSRRVPVQPASAASTGSAFQPDASASTSGALQPADVRPPCAGRGDPGATVWACWECLTDVCAHKPRLPVNACANDNWMGRERTHVRNASRATKMLASLGRCRGNPGAIGYTATVGPPSPSPEPAPLGRSSGDEGQEMACRARGPCDGVPPVWAGRARLSKRERQLAREASADVEESLAWHSAAVADPLPSWDLALGQISAEDALWESERCARVWFAKHQAMSAAANERAQG